MTMSIYTDIFVHARVFKWVRVYMWITVYRCVCTWMCMYACKLLNEAKPGLCCRVSNRSVLSACLVACQNHPDRGAVKRPKHSRAMGIKILAQSPNKTLVCLPHDPIQMISFKKNNKIWQNPSMNHEPRFRMAINRDEWNWVPCTSGLFSRPPAISWPNEPGKPGTQKP